MTVSQQGCLGGKEEKKHNKTKQVVEGMLKVQMKIGENKKRRKVKRSKRSYFIFKAHSMTMAMIIRAKHNSSNNRFSLFITHVTSGCKRMGKI